MGTDIENAGEVKFEVAFSSKVRVEKPNPVILFGTTRIESISDVSWKSKITELEFVNDLKTLVLCGCFKLDLGNKRFSLDVEMTDCSTKLLAKSLIISKA